MTQRLHLHIPAREELGYRQKILSQPETMGYNRGLDPPIPGYDKSTGCIVFPRAERLYESIGFAAGRGYYDLTFEGGERRAT